MGKKDKLIWWVLGIVAVVILIGGGFILFNDVNQTELEFIELCEITGGEVLLPDCGGCPPLCDCTQEEGQGGTIEHNPNNEFIGCGIVGAH